MAESLRSKTVRSIGWSLLAAIWTNVVRIAVLMIIGRLISPDEAGIVATVLTVAAVVSSVRDVGIGQAVIQRKDLTDQQMRSAFAFSLLLGCGLGIVVALLAGPIAALFREPRAEPLIRVIGIMFALRGAATVPIAVLQRDFAFRNLALVDSAAFTIGSIVTCILAWQGYGTWAIISGDILEVALATTAVLLLRKPPFSLVPRWSQIRDLFNYGFGNTLAQLATMAATQGDNLVVRRTLGSESLGFYARAYDLVRIPTTMFTSIVGSVLFPAFSKLQDDRKKLGDALTSTLFATAAVLGPASVGLVVLAPDLIPMVLGDKWHNAVVPFQVMGATMLFRTSYKVGAIVARAAGDTYGVAWSQLAYGVLVVTGAVIGSQWGTAGVATSTAISVFINFVMLTWIGMRWTTATWREVGNAHFQPLVVSAATAITAWPCLHLLTEAGVSPLLRVPITIVFGAIAPITIAAIGTRNKQSRWHWLWRTLRSGKAKKAKSQG